MDENNNEKRIQGELEELINTWTSQIIDKLSKSSEELKAKLVDKITMLCRNEQELGESKKMLKELLNCYTELSSRFREQTRELDTVKAELVRITKTTGNDEASVDAARVKDEPVVIIENEDESHASKIKTNVLGADERTVTTVSSTNLSTSTQVAENKTALNADSSSTTATTTNDMIGTKVTSNNFLPVPVQSARSVVLNSTPNNQVQNGNHKIVMSTKVINPPNTPIQNGVAVLQPTNQMTRPTQPHKLLPLTQSHPQLKSMPVLMPITNSYVDTDTNKKSTNEYNTENNNQSSNCSDDDIMLIDDDEEKFPFTSNNGQGKREMLSGAQLTELYKASPSVEAFSSRLLKYYFTEKELNEQHTTADGLSRKATVRSLDPVRIGYIYRHVMETNGRVDKTLWAKCTYRMHFAINQVRKRHM